MPSEASTLPSVSIASARLCSKLASCPSAAGLGRRGLGRRLPCIKRGRVQHAHRSTSHVHNRLAVVSKYICYPDYTNTWLALRGLWPRTATRPGGRRAAETAVQSDPSPSPPESGVHGAWHQRPHPARTAGQCPAPHHGSVGGGGGSDDGTCYRGHGNAWRTSTDSQLTSS